MAETCSKEPPLQPAPSLPVGTRILNEYIDVANMGVLNAAEEGSLGGVINGGGLLQSDADEQLLIVVPFREAVKLKSVKFLANDHRGKEGSAPKTIKIWMDKPHLDFTDVDNYDPTQEIELSKADAENGAAVDVKFVKFQNVHSLTVFIENNQDEDDVTFLNGLTFIGEVRAGTNMNELKKTG